MGCRSSQPALQAVQRPHPPPHSETTPAHPTSSSMSLSNFLHPGYPPSSTERTVLRCRGDGRRCLATRPLAESNFLRVDNPLKRTKMCIFCRRSTSLHEKRFRKKRRLKKQRNASLPPFRRVCPFSAAPSMSVLTLLLLSPCSSDVTASIPPPQLSALSNSVPSDYSGFSESDLGPPSPSSFSTPSPHSQTKSDPTLPLPSPQPHPAVREASFNLECCPLPKSQGTTSFPAPRSTKFDFSAPPPTPQFFVYSRRA